MIHNYGVFSTIKRARMVYRDISTKEKHTLNLDYQVNHQLDLDGWPCEKSDNYNFDHCIFDLARKQNLEKFGCDTPFGVNKSQICTNQTLGKMAVENLFNLTELHGHLNENMTCWQPCNFLPIQYTDIKTQTYTSSSWKTKGVLIIKYGQMITKTTSFYLYSTLSMVAEIGGYVGLFLGASVYYQLTEMLENMSMKMSKPTLNKK